MGKNILDESSSEGDDGDGDYSPIEHLARAIWLDSYSKDGLLGMFAHTAYFDASYADDQKTITVVSGWVATIEQWESFVVDWRLLLASYHLPYFHMNEFAHSKGPFEKWKNLEDMRAQFLGLAAEVIKENVLHGFASVVHQKHFDSVNTAYEFSEHLGNCYSLASRSCIADCNQWLRKEERAFPVKYIFDQGDAGASELVRIAQLHGFPIPSFEPSRDMRGRKGVIPLQAADFAAYELLKATRDVGVDAPLTHYRRSLQALAKIPNRFGRNDEPQLLDMCKNMKIPLRGER